MKKTLLLIAITITHFLIYSQEKLTTFDNSLAISNSTQKDIYPIVNDKNDYFSIFITDAKNVYIYDFDNEFSITNKLLFKNKRRKYKNIIGYSIAENGNYKLYLKNKKNDFLEITFDKAKKTSIAKEFKLLTDYETYLQSITINNTFYLVSGSKEVNGLYFYTFENNQPKRNKIDLSKLNLLSSVGQESELMSMLMKSSPLLKFDENTPNSIEASSKRRKMYLNNNTIIFTLDNNSNYTQVVSIDLKNLTASSKKFKKPLENIKRRKKKSNSYLSNGKLFTIVISKNLFSLKVIDFNTGEIIKDYSVSQNDSINFKNSPIITSVALFKKYRELKKTKQFLRNMNNKPAINVQYNNNKYYVTIGSLLGKQTNNGFSIGFGSSSTNNINSSSGSSIFFSNNTQYSFNSYMTPFNFMKFSSVFDKDISHLTKEKTINVFEKIKNYLDPDRFKYTAEDFFFSPFKKDNLDPNDIVFKYKNFYIYLDYNKKEKSFELLKFTN